MKRSALAVSIALVVAVAAVASSASQPAQSESLVAHEWGTFTSIAGQDGRAVEWQPFGGPDDLPCFVNQFLNKLGVWGTVRMETPVIYFYADRRTSLDVHVQFRQGLVTEWFPAAQTGQEDPAEYRKRGKASTIAWRGVTVDPQAPQAFSHDERDSHYYTARETDAAPVHAGRESEKFLFYRGVGSFDLPLRATMGPDSTITATNTGADPIPAMVLFSNRHGVQRFQVYRKVEGTIALNEPSAPAAGNIQQELERALVAEGLFPKEASAMVRTWGDSWFEEEGVRLFYIVPPKAIDAVLPLQINPRPVSTVRAFVGRLELITPDIQREVHTALAADDRATLEKFGRFLQPIGDRILAQLPADTDPRPIRQRLAAMKPAPPEPVPERCQ